MNSPINRFTEKIRLFETLNPDVIYSTRKELLQLAEEVDYPDFGSFTESVIEKYLNSPFKRNEREILRDYAAMIERSTQKLIEAGEITLDEPDEQTPAGPGLVIHRHYSETQWLTVLTNSDIPETLSMAVDAIERRKRTVSTILEFLFELFHTLDQEQAFKWEIDFLKNNEHPDPDIIRDLLRSWRQLECIIPAELLEHAIDWCSDEGLRRLWPSIVKEADRVLQIQSLKRLPLEDYSNNAMISSLLRIMPARNDKAVNRWISRALDKLTEEVFFFTELEKKFHDEKDEAFQLAAYRTLNNLQAVFEPFLILSHLMLDAIGGAEKIAMGFMGFSEKRHVAWDDTLHQLASGTIKRFFLNDLKAGQTPLNTIEKLCFGNEYLFRRIVSELDFKTKQFESLAQREKAENILAHNYASYRENKLLGEELSRRYRRFMRMVHEDSLRRFLKPEHLEKTLNSVLVTEYAVTAAQARKFISAHRNENIPAEEAFAAKEEFIAILHKRRRLLIRRIIHEYNRENS